MNQPSNHSNQTPPGTNTQFPSNQSTQSNPFTADLKGEFTSNFGTNTNAVSQIFRDGSFGGSNTTKWLMIGGATLVIVVLGYFLYSSGTNDNPYGDIENVAEENVEPSTDEITDDTAAMMDAEGEADGEETYQDDEQAYDQEIAQPDVAMNPATQAFNGNIQLIGPLDGDSRVYDETAGPAVFEWSGGQGTIVFSRKQFMSPVYMRVPAAGGRYEFHHPYPGTWFWRVETPEGFSETRSFFVQPAVRRALAISEPAPGASIAAEGGVVSWTGDSKVAFYRVEFSNDASFANPAYRFSTSSQSVQTQGMTPGEYQMRVGAFSEVAGRWEYTQPLSVSVQ